MMACQGGAGLGDQAHTSAPISDGRWVRYHANQQRSMLVLLPDDSGKAWVVRLKRLQATRPWNTFYFARNVTDMASNCTLLFSRGMKMSLEAQMRYLRDSWVCVKSSQTSFKALSVRGRIKHDCKQDEYNQTYPINECPWRARKTIYMSCSTR